MSAALGPQRGLRLVNFRFVDFLELVFLAGFALEAVFLAAVFFFAGEDFFSGSHLL